MEDLEWDEDFDLNITNRGDFGTVSGRAAFEQRLRYVLQDSLTEVIRSEKLNEESIANTAKTRAQSVAEFFDEIENISAFIAEFPDEKPNTLELTIIYDTGEEFIFEVQP